MHLSLPNAPKTFSKHFREFLFVNFFREFFGEICDFVFEKFTKKFVTVTAISIIRVCETVFG